MDRLGGQGLTVFQTIILKIAEKFNLKLQLKKDDAAPREIDMTSVVSNRVATVTMLDSGASVEGENQRAKWLNDFLQEYISFRMPVAAEVSLWTGDCLVKPYTDGKRIGIDIIKNQNFVICESIGNFIKSCIIKAEQFVDKNGNKFERYEAQELREAQDGDNTIPVLVIRQMAFKNENEVPLSSVPAWANMQDTTIIPNVSKLLFGRYKCPTINRFDVNGADGVKITYGLDNVMKKAVDAYNRFNDEFERKEAFLFIDKTLLRKKPDDQSQYEIPKGKERYFLKVRGEESNLIQEYSPDIRSDQLEKGIEVNFKILEMFIGLSSGILTAPTTNYASATEIRANLQATYAFVTKFRAILEAGTVDMLEAVDILCNVNNITPPGEWLAKFDWSSSFIENVQEQFSRLMQAESIGAVGKEEVRAWVMDEDVQTAKERTNEIAETFVNEVI